MNALTDINLIVRTGDFLAIAGSSGSGKTTLLNLLGILDRPTSGCVLIDGVDVSQLSSRELAAIRSQKIGFVFQTFNLLPVLTAFENVEYPLLLQHMTTEQRKTKVEDALQRVGIEKLGKHRPDQLSGGQRQRVAVARAIVKHPSVILADEPTANLDKKTATAVLELMHQLNREDGVTFLFSSHDPMILSLANRVVKLSDGRQVAEKAAKERHAH